MRCSSTIGANLLAVVPQLRLQRRQRAAGAAGPAPRPCGAPAARQTRLGCPPQLDKRAGRCAAAQQEQGGAPPPPPRQPEQPEQQALVGEDAAVFDLSQQSLRSWVLFGALLTGVLAMLYPVRQRRHPCLLPFFPRSSREGVVLVVASAMVAPSRCL